MSDTQSLNTEQLNELLKKNGLSIITNTGDAGAGDAGAGDAGAGDAGADDAGKIKVDDLIAERDSLKSELDQIKKEQKLILTELKKTKEVNFTLARQTSANNQASKTPEELINEMFK